MNDVISQRKNFTAKRGEERTEDEIKEEIFDFIENDEFEEIDDKPRIILVAKEFRPEVTATSLWLRKFGVDITCIKLEPYKIDEDKIGVVTPKIISIPDAEEFMIMQNGKRLEKGL